VKLKPLALGLSLGIVWGFALFVTTWLCYFTGYGKLLLEVLAGSIYPGYSISPLGSLLGFVYGFIDLTIMGLLVGWIYNKVLIRAESAK
jgi:CDP-diglyceride synthetase